MACCWNKLLRGPQTQIRRRPKDTLAHTVPEEKIKIEREENDMISRPLPLFFRCVYFVFLCLSLPKTLTRWHTPKRGPGAKQDACDGPLPHAGGPLLCQRAIIYGGE